MKIKEGARIAGLNIRMRPALIELEKIFNEINTDFVITSGLDGTHSAGSYHYYGLAIDVRTREIPVNKTKEFVNKVISSMDKLGFKAIFEETHLHVEAKQWAVL